MEQSNYLTDIDNQNKRYRQNHKSAEDQAKKSYDAIFEHNGGLILSDMYQDDVKDVNLIRDEIEKFYQTHKDELHELALSEDVARSELEIK